MPDHGRPTPAARLGDHLDACVRVRCACGHGGTLRLRDIAGVYRLPPATRLSAVTTRLRCGQCGAAPEAVDVADRPGLHFL